MQRFENKLAMLKRNYISTEEMIALIKTKEQNFQHVLCSFNIIVAICFKENFFFLILVAMAERMVMIQ